MLPDIHLNKLNIYAKIIKLQGIFNIHSSIANKTQARAAVEWLLCSTISYAMAVACSHFITEISPTEFHPKKKELNQESLEMWKIVKKTYNKMIGNPQNEVKLQSIIPNLITSTNKVMLFTTSSEINRKESYYLVSKPDIKMKQ